MTVARYTEAELNELLAKRKGQCIHGYFRDCHICHAGGESKTPAAGERSEGSMPAVPGGTHLAYDANPSNGQLNRSGQGPMVLDSLTARRTATPTNKALDKAHSPFRSKLEAAYCQYLHCLMLGGDIQFYKYEPVRLILANDCTLTVDFLVMMKDGSLEWHEVKGRRREDAMIKLRVAAKTFHWWKFILVERRRGIWEQREMSA